MKIIKLTLVNSRVVLVNANRIEMFYKNSDKTRIKLTNSDFDVKETPEEIENLIKND